ncbi:hypothetical protein LTS18_012819 [Coniosporium uncinatum]|uniref:Uncharacterized protein n=1 Tax=Coniosporium uncinatum TaxID=93489 RepID=A0ACC3DVV4_9PEZI|nr:hypothetical protein LTS18_012819 [Coniosporium uncinatum]
MLRGRLAKLFFFVAAVLVFFFVWESSLGTFEDATSNAPDGGRKWGKPRPEGQEELRYEVPASPRPTWNLMAEGRKEGEVLDQEGKAVLAGEQQPQQQQAPVPTATESMAATSTKTVAAQSTNLREYMVNILKWQRSTGVRGHSPAYEEFAGKYYDPNRWEGFQHEVGYYLKNGIKRFFGNHWANYAPYLPYPAYNTKQWKREWRGKHYSCVGPSGKPLNQSWEDLVFAYEELPPEFPEPLMGSYEAIGLDKRVCIDRKARYSPFGLNQIDWAVAKWAKFPGLKDWENVDWGGLQDQCMLKNQERFAYHARKRSEIKPGTSLPSEAQLFTLQELAKSKKKREHVEQKFASRTAVLIRTWEGYRYTQNDMYTIRAIITELSLRSGGEYQVFLFVNVKDRSEKIFDDPEVYESVLRKAVPQELRSIAILWNEDTMKAWYPDVGDWQVYWNQFMCVQWFSKTHPEFDFVWNWEMDVRYTGNHFHLLSKLSDFARRQPRKYQWERNSRFYIPSAPGHGDWESFFRNTNALIGAAAHNKQIPTPIWGAAPYAASQTPLGPLPPVTQDQDNFAWGVDSDADLITLLPMWDPRKTEWVYRNKIWNFVPGHHPIFDDTAHGPTDKSFDHAFFRQLDRRVVINTVVRLSKPLLHAMHEENRAGRTMQAEMWPATVALHHGFKAVYAPHPVFSSRKWDPVYADAVFNAAAADLGKLSGGDPQSPFTQIPGRWGQEADSVYNPDRENNFKALSWYYFGRFGRVLWRRWMGWPTSSVDEGYVAEDSGGGILEDGMGMAGTSEWESGGGNGRLGWAFGGGSRGPMCLPGMLVHPIKRRDHAREGE